MNLDRKYVVSSLCYAVLGMGLGVYMAASHNHAEHVTHAHILLVGAVLSFIYGIIHKLWLAEPVGTVAKLQFLAHHLGAITMFVGLFVLYGNMVPEPTIGPILGIASILVLIAALLMLFMVVRTKAGTTARVAG